MSNKVLGKTELFAVDYSNLSVDVALMQPLLDKTDIATDAFAARLIPRIGLLWNLSLRG
jgi:hypothetical protein